MYCSDNVLSKWRIHAKQATQTMGGIVHLENIKECLDYINKRKIKLSVKSSLLIMILKLYVKYLFQIILKINK